VEWGRGPWSWRAVLAFLPRGPRVPSYATGCRSNKLMVVLLFPMSFAILYKEIALNRHERV